MENNVTDGVDEAVRGAKGKFQEAKRAARDFIESNDGVDEGSRREGEVTKVIESFTTQIPSGAFLSLAMASVGGSLCLQLAGKKEAAQFVGNWVPTILLLGLYNKLVKIEGSEH